ncbi:hypothetical protein CRE_18730 [Caenorhabditis remanei]|uniref:Hexosyltransferase n=1 Tax=Caenorhabditis remanei TaxID=31234 RepID=E3LJP1_CAERE|nr:hypothetical protein CRE_18730 [Caenorhabditis remanei]
MHILKCMLFLFSIASSALLIYFQAFTSVSFSDDDRECIRNEWQKSSLIDGSQDFGADFRISFADTHHLFKWIHLPVLPVPGPEILMIVTSRPDNLSRRNILRNSWKDMNKRMKYLFFIGLGGEIGQKTNEIVKKEAELYGDIVITDMDDNYLGLSYKVGYYSHILLLEGQNSESNFQTLSLLLFSFSKSPSSQLIGKIDEDVMFFPDQLIELIDNGFIDMKGSNMYGYIVEAGAPVQSECAVLKAPRTSYSCTKYPEYLAGPFYLVTNVAAQNVLKASKHRRFLISEDVLVTGLLASDVGVRRTQLPNLHMFPDVAHGPVLAWHTKLDGSKYLEKYEQILRKQR